MRKQAAASKSETLNQDERTALLAGLKSEENDQDVSLEESIEFARNRRKQWTKANLNT